MASNKPGVPKEAQVRIEGTPRTLKPMPKPDIDDSTEGNQLPQKPKLIATALCLALLLLLIMVLPLALTLGNSSSFTPEDSISKSQRRPQTPHDSMVATNSTVPNTSSTTTTLEPETKVTRDPDGGSHSDETQTEDSNLAPDEYKEDNENGTAPVTHWRPKPPPIAKCTDFGFPCLNNETIGSHQRCNGALDCTDGSDEAGCKECVTSFSCAAQQLDNAICLQASSLCLKGDPICPGGEDIEICTSCKAGSHKCKSSERCIPKSWKCDGEEHCPKGDDESGCRKKDCQANAFWCRGGHKCLPIWQKCDGVKQCKDGSDELSCDCMGCSGKNKVLCKDNGMCILRSQLCDGTDDCPGKEDEINCPGYCEDGKRVETIVCKNRRISKRLACSGSKEECEEHCKQCDQEVAFTCKRGKRKCVPKLKVCDGIRDCEDGSDEFCDCLYHSDFRCPATVQIQSNTGFPKTLQKCIRANQTCDGFPDCPGKEDEMNCDSCRPIVPEVQPVYCKDERRCYPSTNRCDGEVNCNDYSDEDNCSCSECKSHEYPTFLCNSNNRCLRKEFVCNPKSPFHCPGHKPEDEIYRQPDYDPLKSRERGKLTGILVTSVKHVSF